jgi:hypothetical protein
MVESLSGSDFVDDVASGIVEGSVLGSIAFPGACVSLTLIDLLSPKPLKRMRATRTNHQLVAVWGWVESLLPLKR